MTTATIPTADSPEHSNTSKESLEAWDRAAEGVLEKLGEAGVTEAGVIAEDLARDNGAGPDIFDLAERYRTEARYPIDANYQRRHAKRADLAEAVAAVSATTAVYATMGPEAARPTASLARSIVRDMEGKRHGNPARDILMAMLDEVSGEN